MDKTKKDAIEIAPSSGVFTAPVDITANSFGGFPEIDIKYGDSLFLTDGKVTRIDRDGKCVWEKAK